VPRKGNLFFQRRDAEAEEKTSETVVQKIFDELPVPSGECRMKSGAIGRGTDPFIIVRGGGNQTIYFTVQSAALIRLFDHEHFNRH
jgi:hypothetical protein